MRYCVFSAGVNASQIEADCKEAGALNIRVVPRLKQVFCELTIDQVAELMSVGLKVKEVKTIKSAQVAVPTLPAQNEVTPLGLNLSTLFNSFRGSFEPPLTGVGLTVAVLDSGIHKTHESLIGKVIYEENFSDAEDCDDIYDHGTGIAYIIAGGTQGLVNSGVSPGAKIMNIKVLGDDGIGTDEWLIAGLDRVCDLVEQAIADHKERYDEDYPNIINLSVGADDDGDVDNPVREACRVAVDEFGLQVVAAAGNSGDQAGTILIPACDSKVIAIGGLLSDVFMIWQHSSRGPTQEGLIKPDFVLWATNIYVASASSDSAYKYNSGTSFSAPIASSIMGLIVEEGRRNYGPGYYATWYEVRNVGEDICIKPEGMPAEKDNWYGYGLPDLGPLVEGVQPVTPTTAVTEMMPLFAMMMIMVPIMSMARS